MEERIRVNIKKFREGAGLTQKGLADRIGKSESAIQAYESGKTDIPLSGLLAILKTLGISLTDLERGSRADVKEDKPMEVLIYNQDDRLNTAAILIKNGYTVEQGKRQRTQTGKAVDYFLRIRKYSETADTSR